MAMIRPIAGPRTLGGGSYSGGDPFAPTGPGDPTTMPVRPLPPGDGLPSATSGGPLAPGGLGNNPFPGTMPDNIWAQMQGLPSSGGTVYWTDASGSHGASMGGPVPFTVGGPGDQSSGAPSGGATGMPSGIDPALAAIYQQGGLTPAGRGTGFADWQYWQDKGPSQYARLIADIAGTGTDQPTGTPGQGAWMTSGQGGAPAGAASLLHGGDPGVSAGADQILAQVEGNLNSYIRQLLSSSQGNAGGSGDQGGNNQQPI